MNPRQNAMYWAEWSKLRDQLQARGKSIAQCEDYRHALTTRALGADKSSTAFTNVELDRVLARMRAEREPTNLDAQIALQESPERRRGYILSRCTEVCALMWSRGNDHRLTKSDARIGYIAGTARNLIKKELDDCTAEELAKVLGALEARLKRLIARAQAPIESKPVGVENENPF